MQRITYYDKTTKCYKVKPEIIGRSIVQELGVYEDIHAEEIKAAEHIQEIRDRHIDDKVELNPYWSSNSNGRA